MVLTRRGQQQAPALGVRRFKALRAPALRSRTDISWESSKLRLPSGSTDDRAGSRATSSALAVERGLDRAAAKRARHFHGRAVLVRAARRAPRRARREGRSGEGSVVKLARRGQAFGRTVGVACQDAVVVGGGGREAVDFGADALTSP